MTTDAVTSSPTVGSLVRVRGQRWIVATFEQTRQTLVDLASRVHASRATAAHDVYEHGQGERSMNVDIC